MSAQAASSLDETLFGRIAVFNNYLRQEQLDECLEIQRTTSPTRSIGEILLEKGFITSEQLRVVLEVRRKKVRKVGRRVEEAKRSNRGFGELALNRRLISLEDLEGAVLEQQRLDSLNLHFCLGEVLVAQGKMTPADVIDVLARQGKCILICPGCDSHFNVTKHHEGRSHHCPHCGVELIQPRFLDTIAVDGVLVE